MPKSTQGPSHSKRRECGSGSEKGGPFTIQFPEWIQNNDGSYYVPRVFGQCEFRNRLISIIRYLLTREFLNSQFDHKSPDL